MKILTADFHTHILPEIDDGSKSVEESLEMLYKEQSDGVESIFLTPHFSGQQMYPDTFLTARENALNQLRRVLSNHAKMPELISGAEVQYSPGMSQWEQLDLLSIGDSKYILIEMPFAKWTDSIYSELRYICFQRGLTPIIAHVERYLTRFNAKRVLNCLLSIPVLLQVNCEFLTDKRTQNTALKLLKEQKVHLIGSDCHSATWRSPIMAEAREVLLSNADAQTLAFLENNERNVMKKINSSF